MKRKAEEEQIYWPEEWDEDGDNQEEAWEETQEDAGAAPDWRKRKRRPFRRGFVHYGRGSLGEDVVAKRRAKLGIKHVEDPAEGMTPAPFNSFDEFGVLPPWLGDGLREAALYEPEPLPAQALPILLGGQNLLAVTPSDCSRSLAYLLPAITHIEDQPPLDVEDPGPVALVLCSTREEVAQAHANALKLLKLSSRSRKHPGGMRVLTLAQGLGTKKEQREQAAGAGAHILLGTPNRVADMASAWQVSLARVTFFAIDGLDQVLEQGHVESLVAIAAQVRPERQLALFSTKWTQAVTDNVWSLCRCSGQPVKIVVANKKAKKKASEEKADE